ncbi:YfcL family protein [Aidingimonas lacisalsi]|uniref:YfcL family protein n=1 Tax=Aidingimonas lacisalsi TaxID=2604086 RepID=UPI0013762A9B|nr:YfcL family protein [Aidingimonas lacisalsi]
MPDPLARRADAIHQALVVMEQQADDDDLFALGYLIPQVPLVMEMVEYDPENVLAEDFDDVFLEWLNDAFTNDAMSQDDQHHIRRLWDRAVQEAETT